jgi:HlyD family secretion protein
MNKKFITLGLAAITVILLAVLFLKDNDSVPYEAADDMAAQSSVSRGLLVTGKVEPLDFETIIIPGGQKVNKVFFSEGQIVQAGDVILTTDTADLQYELKKNQLALDTSEKALNRLYASGDDNGALSLRKQCELNLEIAMADYNESGRIYQKNQILYENGVISEEELHTRSQNREVLSAKADLAKIALADFESNLNQEIIQQKNMIASYQADIENILAQIEKSKIKANISGQIVGLNIKEGQYAASDNNVVAIHDVSGYKIAVEATQYDTATLSLGQICEITIKGLPKIYCGAVSKIAETAHIDKASGRARVAVEIAVDNPDGSIKSGYEADITIINNDIFL